MPHRGADRPPDQAQGIWSWNQASFNNKYTRGAEEACWIWQGSAGPQAALFGAYKNSRPQMTQARRIAWMQHTVQSCEQLQITMRCRNSMCVNPHHMLPKPTNRKDCL